MIIPTALPRDFARACLSGMQLETVPPPARAGAASMDRLRLCGGGSAGSAALNASSLCVSFTCWHQAAARPACAGAALPGMGGGACGGAASSAAWSDTTALILWTGPMRPATLQPSRWAKDDTTLYQEQVGAAAAVCVLTAQKGPLHAGTQVGVAPPVAAGSRCPPGWPSGKHAPS